MIVKAGFLVFLVSISAYAVKDKTIHNENYGKGNQKPVPGITSPANQAPQEEGDDDEGNTLRPQTVKSNGNPEVGSSGCPPFSIETLVHLASNHRPTATTDGVYFVSDVKEVPQLYFQNKPEQNAEVLTTFPDGIRFYHLSPKGDKVLVGTDEKGDEQYDVYLLDPKTKQSDPLLVSRKKRVESVLWAADGSSFYYTANDRNGIDMDLYRFDLAAKKSTLLAELSGNNTVTDLSPNGEWLSLTQYRSVTDSDILLFNTKLNKVASILKATEKSAFLTGKFSADSQHLFYLSDLDKGYFHLYISPLKKLSERKKVSQGMNEVDSFELDKPHRKLGLVYNQEGYSSVDLFTLENSGQRKKLIPFIKPESAILSSLSFYPENASTQVFYAKTSSVKPSEIYSAQSGKETQWSHFTSKVIPPQCFTGEKKISFPSFDKKMIPGFLYLPASQKTPLPIAVYVHGGPEGQFRPGFNRVFQYLIQKGWGIFAPNVRGSTGYGREFTMLDNYKKRMDSVKDVIEGTEWLVKNRTAKEGHLALYGGSYGGFLVLRSLQVKPDLFSVASESVGITDFVTFLKNTKPYRRKLREVEYGPLSDEAFLKSVSPMTYLDQLKTPLIIFHGANDPRVPLSETEQLVKALQQKSIPVEFKVFSDEGHGSVHLKNILEQSQSMVYFFEKTLSVKLKTQK